MSRFTVTANLPHKAGTVLLGEKYAEILDNPIKNAGIRPVYVPDNPFVDSRLSGHADLSVLHLGGEECLLSKHLKGTGLSQWLCDIGTEIKYLSEPMGSVYPKDAALNCCIVGDSLIYNQKTVAPEIAEYFTSNSSRLINVKQGYSRCSVCVVNEKAVITSDRGIAKAVHAAGMDVLLIAQGYVNLPGFDYGFFGGSAFKISFDRIAFTGTLDKHPDKQQIYEFLRKNRVEPVFLTQLPIFDIGGAAPILEK